MVGLDIAYDNSNRVFTNGVEFDQEKHGALYRDDDYFELTNDTCPLAMLWPGDPTSIEISDTWCEIVTHCYICFEPKKQALLIIGSSGSVLLNLFLVGEPFSKV